MNTAARILIVDDDHAFTSAAAALAASEGSEAIVAATCEEARAQLRAGRMDLVVLDLALPDGSGLDLLDEIDPLQHGRIVVLTGSPSLDSAVRACSAPVSEYLLKPLDPERWLELVRRASPGTRLASDSQLMRTHLLGRSSALRETVSTLLRAAPSDASVLITGESGTGKELAARTLHDASGRKGAFVAITCAAVDRDVLATQLFGQERGAFGAGGRRAGALEQAADGTLLIDGICELPNDLQIRLLRVLETSAYTQESNTPATPLPARVVATTYRDPSAAIAQGLLRDDLYHRLSDICVHMPPLRERDDDVILLARAFIDRLNARHGLRKRLAPSSERLLLRHLWPGNVRELQSTVQRAYVLDANDSVVVSPVTRKATVLDETDTSILFTVGMTMAEMERRVLLKTLAHYNNDKTAAARALGISVRTVHNHLARMAQERADTPEQAA